ncbi:methylated-DNA--[protein]-cysteine S-methyltransferase [Angustibacter sp. Root456]|uniref:methylated-DNA--[protein]-cysteine S-methyltransferase n=1 Tax=Angustibacter sp. Root456 TaxID=1736539 RepID=UPI000A83CCBF|nr:methylated-DNA--[protein]-cysteine S-methyltransferase [Angustibacter sp. Root456]
MIADDLRAPLVHDGRVLRWTLVPSPVDDLLAVSDGEALTALWFSPHTRWSAAHPDAQRDDGLPLFADVRRQLDAYFARELREFDLPLAPRGSAFQQRVWAALREIPWGQTRSYGEIAARLGLGPEASRAVGTANGANPIPVIVPCHRVIGADGTLTGFAGGLPRKRFLLDLEADLLF